MKLRLAYDSDPGMSFLFEMQKRLADNQDLGSFESWNPDRFELFEDILRNVHALADAVRYNNPEAVDRHAADLGNFAMKAALKFGVQDI